MRAARNAAQRARRKAAAKAAGRARALLDAALDRARVTAVGAGVEGTHALVTPAVRFHVVSALGGTDPEMPASVRRGIDLVAEDVCVSVELTVYEALHARLQGPQDETAGAAARIIAAPSPPCCKPNCASWLRAKVLYTLFPHDRSVWSQLQDPWWYLFKLLSVFPLFYVSIGTWFVLWTLKDKGDEFQLVSFIVQMKSSLFYSALISSVVGNVLYLRCTTLDPGDAPCGHHAPGQLQPFWPVVFVFWLQITLTWVSALLNCCSTVKGRRVALPGRLDTSKLIQDLEKQTNRRRSRIFCWLMWDLVACAIVIGAAIGVSVSMEEDGASPSSGGVNATVTTSPEMPASAIVGEPSRDLKEVLYWIRVLYGFLCLPWVVLCFPGMFPLLLHAKPTGYNRRGQTCPTATASERLANWQRNRIHDDGSGSQQIGAAEPSRGGAWRGRWSCGRERVIVIKTLKSQIRTTGVDQCKLRVSGSFQRSNLWQ